jgi:hypothetical protein
MINLNKAILGAGVMFFASALFGQIDSTYVEEEEDYSIYDNVEDVGEIKVFCSPKIFDLSPNRFISIGYDYVAPAAFDHSSEGTYEDGDNPAQYSNKFSSTGLRINSNIPVVSKSSVIWQIGGGYNRAAYQDRSDPRTAVVDGRDSFLPTFLNRGLTTINLNTTIFKPFNENSFAIVQIMGEQAGSYDITKHANELDLANTRLSVSALWGKRPNDNKQWAVGLSRTFRAGEVNIVPIVMYNYTSENRKWGTEILFPARAAYRRKFNPRSILLVGYELQGTTYRLYGNNLNAVNPELRRGELRFKLDYQRQLKGFVWWGIQAGLRQNYSFHVDDLGNSNKDFFRGFFGDQTYIMRNRVGAAPYLNFSLNLVSP